MDETQKYLFDLNGFLVIENAVPQALVDGCNAVLDRFEEMDPAEYPPPLSLGNERTEGNLYISNVLEGDEILLDLMDLSPVLDVIGGVTGAPYRLNHTYAIYRWGGGYTHLHMHGTPVNPKCQYRCHSGQMVSTLTKAVFRCSTAALRMAASPLCPAPTKRTFRGPSAIIQKRIPVWCRCRRRRATRSFSRRR